MSVFNFSVSSHVAKPAALVAAMLLSACGQQSSGTAPPAAAANGQPAAEQAPASTQPAPASMSVAELTGASAPATAPANSAQTPVASAPASSATTGANSTTTAFTQLASAQPLDEGQFARVVSVQALSQPQRVCTPQTVTERRRPEDRHQVAGTVIGAIAGGLIGSKIGHGSGRGIATVGGAVGGGFVGKKIQEDHQDNDTVTRVVQRCHTVTPGRDGVALYDVVYAYQGQNFHVRLDHDPGERIELPVRGIQ
ncbi:MAG TPA: glycine zipper 2TM domain-containing protein [Rudaea sp.]|uniref:glycine zipper 2TM domain-containing protein n=1 Tax=Rudaea sp. TaxID=2136325 RepID=UPI002F94D047